jgi:pimeloyl-ACP methyl ester carboxylesterase
VIAVHAYNGNRTGVIYHAGLLGQHGYGVLLFDLRAHGESEGEHFAFGWDADQDVFAGAEFLKNRLDVQEGRIGALGLSIGAEVVLQAAARSDAIRAVVAEGSGYHTFEDWRLALGSSEWFLIPGDWAFFKTGELLSGIPSAPPLTTLVPQISPTPLLLISAGQDNVFGRAYYQLAGEPKAWWERAEAGHIDALFVHPEEYGRRVIGFFDEALLGR